MELGAGFVFFSGFEPALERCAHLVDVLEVEPQTFWFSGGASAEDVPRVDREYLARVAALPFPKLVHGVGFPVGGTEAPNPAQRPALAETIAALRPPWFSEHLSFNHARRGEERFQTAFLLPPCQNEAGAQAAIRSIRSLQESISTPVAIETGVNYLQPMKHEMPDGEFIARVVEATGCGILLDLHNIWANERNGRQSVDAFMNAIPLEQVWELHLAGGHEHRGIWLDAHSGAVPDELFEMSRGIVRTLPRLGAIIFEMFPGYLMNGDFSVFEEQMVKLRRLWDQRGKERQVRTSSRVMAPSHEVVDPALWEDTLGALVLERHTGSALGNELAADPGIAVMAHLIREFRGSVLSRNLKFTCRLLMIELGDAPFMDLLAEFWRLTTPELFGSSEARKFAEFLRAKKLPVLGLAEVLDFEISTINTLLDGSSRVVHFGFDPMPVFRSLADGQRPAIWKHRDFAIEIVPDEQYILDGEPAAGLQLLH